MFLKLKEFLSRSKNQLFSIPSTGQKVNKFVLVLILAADAFILFSVVDGVRKAQYFIEYPVNPIREACEDFYKFHEKNPQEKLSFLRKYSEQDAHYDPTNELANTKAAPPCIKAQSELKALDTSWYLNKFGSIDAERREVSNLNYQKSDLKNSYESALLEKIAGQEENDSILPAKAKDIKKKVKDIDDKIATHEQNINSLEAAVLSHAQALKLENLTKGHDPSIFKKYIIDYDLELKFYPIKTFFMGVIFLIPLLLLSIVLNRRAHRKNANIEILATAHLILIFLLPLLFVLLSFIYSLLPKLFLGRLIGFLLELDLGFIWNYASILFTMGLLAIIIVFTQKFLGNTGRRRRNQLKHQECSSCDEKLSSLELAHCYFCGASQLSECKGCGKLINKNYIHCPHCGT